MSTEVGILRCGAYVPRRRLDRPAIYENHAWFAPHLQAFARGHRAIANWDEDTITMAVEAARDALDGYDRARLGSLVLASTTLPFEDRLNCGVVKEALNLPDSVRTIDVAGSLRAGTTALIDALHVSHVDAAPRLCIGADLRKTRPGSESELTYGDASAAILVGAGAPIARFLGAHSVSVDFIDHYRATGSEYDYAWESRWVRDEGYLNIAAKGIAEAMERFAPVPTDIDHCLIALPVRAASEALARRLKLKVDPVSNSLLEEVGDPGTCYPLLMLAHALERAEPGQKILLAGFGQGVDTLLFEATPALKEHRQSASVSNAIAAGKACRNYSRFLFHRGLLDLDLGMRAEADHKVASTALYRHRKSVLSLVGGKCTKTGAVQFPKAEISVAPDERAINTQEDYPLAERAARIVTYTADRLSYSPDPPLYYGMIDFEGGGRMIAEFADAEPHEIDVGRGMRMVFRIKSIDTTRRFKGYFWKATPTFS